MRHISQGSDSSVEDMDAKTGNCNAMYSAISETEEHFSSRPRGNEEWVLIGDGEQGVPEGTLV